MQRHQNRSKSYHSMAKATENSSNQSQNMLRKIIPPFETVLKSSQNLVQTSTTENAFYPNPRLGTTKEEKENQDLNFLNKKQLVSEIFEAEEKPFESFTSIKSMKTLKSPESKINLALIKDKLLNNLIFGAFRKLLKATFYRKLSDLKPEQRTLFGDLADFRDNEDKSKKLTTPFAALMGKIVINPYKKAKMTWNFLTFSCFLLLFLFVPFELSFAAWIDSGPVLFLYILSLIVISCDLVVTLNTAIFIKGCQVNDRLLILKHYIKQSLLKDLGGFVAIIYALGLNNSSDPISQCPKLLIFMKFPQFLTLYYEILQYFRLLDKEYKNLIDLLKLLLFSLFIAHLGACLWHFCGIMGLELQPGGKSWLLVNPNVVNGKCGIRYLYSLYWSVVTMMTVGYGDITPLNTYEVFFTIVAIVAGCAVYAYNLNSIGLILQKIHQEDQELNEKIAIIDGFMLRKNIDKDLNMRVREYLKFLWSEKKARQSEQELEIINTLNEHLREELLLEAYGGIFKAFPMFYHNFSEKSLKRTLAVLKEKRFMPGDIIFTQREIDESSMFYINDGEVDLMIEGTSADRCTHFKTLKTGQVFGETSFFSGGPRQFTAKCRVFTNVFALPRSQFISILHQSREDIERFLMIKDQLLFTGKNTAFQSRCLSCGQCHSLKRCDLFHYQPDREKIIKKFEFSLFQNRRAYKRRKVTKINSLDIKQKVSNQVKGWLREMLLQRRQKETESKANDPDKLSAVFSLDEQLVGSNESLQTLEVEEFLEQIDRKETRALSIHTPLDQIERKETRSYSSDLIPLETGERKEAKALSMLAPDFPDRRDVRGLSQPPTEDIEERPSGNSKNFIRMRSKKHSQISKESGVLEKKNDMQKSQVLYGDFAREFEKAHRFKKYFPEDNFDCVATLCEKNRRKTLFFQKFRSGTLKQNPTITSELAFVEDHHEKLKNMNLYTFYPDLIRNRLLRYFTKRQRSMSPKRKNMKAERSEESCSPNRRSVFFKRQEFKNKQTFSAFVNSVVQMAKTKVKKPREKK